VASYAPYGPSVLVIQTPFYRGGGVPTDLSVRRRQFLGVSATVINPETLLDAALQGHPGIGVTLHFHGSGSDVAFSSHVPKGSQPDRVEDLGNGWTAETVGPSTARSTMFRVPSARNLLLTGCAVSILLGLLVFVLGTGRARALRLVAEKTEHIRLQSLHDGLTGLPNRVLILDRVEQALTRARRGGTPVAVMFLDLDGFKGINDTYGHAVGDQLLQAVSTRLLGAIRGSDTVGRLGGDEFILVVEGDSLVDGASPIADRILAALAIPFELRTPEPLVVRTHASVGIATGLRDDASQLLRDADAAMYQAKATGKNRQVTYAASMRADV
ncbi:MAG: diguanylate cyclase, partial [Actinomycetota bacterium]|nr:diguanylate cyclase [Actinomycetota bacterium]